MSKQTDTNKQGWNDKNNEIRLILIDFMEEIKKHHREVPCAISVESPWPYVCRFEKLISDREAAAEKRERERCLNLYENFNMCTTGEHHPLKNLHPVEMHIIRDKIERGQNE